MKKLKYNYIFKDNNLKIFNLLSNDKDIELFLKTINGVYIKLNWLIQIDNYTLEKKEYLIHNKNGIISEYSLQYINGRKIR